MRRTMRWPRRPPDRARPGAQCRGRVGRRCEFPRFRRFADPPCSGAGRWRRGLYCRPEENGQPRGNAPQNAPRVVAASGNPAVFPTEGIVGLAAAQAGHVKPRAEFQPFNGGNGEYAAGNAVFQPVEHGVANAGGKSHGGAFDNAPQGIPLTSGGLNGFGHGFSLFQGGQGPGGNLANFRSHGVEGPAPYSADLQCLRRDFHALFPQQLQNNSARRT